MRSAKYLKNLGRTAGAGYECARSELPACAERRFVLALCSRASRRQRRPRQLRRAARPRPGDGRATASPAIPRPAAALCRRAGAANPFGLITDPEPHAGRETGIGRWCEGRFRTAPCTRAQPDGLAPLSGLSLSVLHQGDPRRTSKRSMTICGRLRRSNGVVAERCRSRSTSASRWWLELAVLHPGLFVRRPANVRRIQPRRLSGGRPRPLRRLPHPAECLGANRPISISRATGSTTGSPPISPTIRRRASATGPPMTSCNTQARPDPRTSLASGPMKDGHREFDVEDAGCRSQGDRGLFEGTGPRRSPRLRRYRPRIRRMQRRKGDIHRYLLGLSYR